MQKKLKTFIIFIVLIVILSIAIIAVNLIKKYTPGKEKADLNKYFALEGALGDDVLAVIVDNEIAEEKSIIVENNVYLNILTIKKSINNKFYWDYNENVLIFTTPSDLIKVEIASNDYYVNKNRNSLNVPIVKSDGDNVYVLAEFIKMYTGIEYKLHSDPQRVSIINTWGEFNVANVKRDSVIRRLAGIKSPIISDVNKNDQVTIIEEEGKWSKVNFEGGFIGYIRNKDLGKITRETRTTAFVKPVYTSMSKAGKVNMTWHQVTNRTANNSLVELTEKSKGINVVSPTWFTLADGQGNLNSLADSTYVNRANQLGYEVWALIADFTDDDLGGERIASVLPYTSKRENMTNKLVSLAIEYNLDGINVDFEKIKQENGDDYVQFLRELSIKCRSNNIILSINNYVPSAWTVYYNTIEQGEIADYVVIMAYDEHVIPSDGAGPVASIGFVDKAITDILENVDESKVIIGIPFYARLWEEKEDGNLSSRSYGMGAVNNIISNRDLTKTWMDDLGVNYCEYEEDGSTFKIWVEDGQSIEEKLKIINENNVAGIASWKLGLEDSDIWNIILKYIN